MTVSVVSPRLSAQTPLPFNNDQWALDSREARIEEYRGRTAICFWGASAHHRTARLRDGVAEFFLAPGARRGFIGMKLRMQSPSRFEDLYFRLHKSGQADAVQYVPEFHFDGAWQLFHGEGYTAAASWVPDEWVRVRAVVQGDRAALFVGDTSRPVLVVPQLARGIEEGGIGFWSFFPGGPQDGTCAARIADVSIRPGPVAFRFPAPLPGSAPAGVITAWELSEPFDAGDGTVRTPPGGSGVRWRQVEAEPFGSVLVSRHINPLPGYPRKGVWARVTILSDSIRVVPFDFGFSDDVSVFLNGTLLFSAQNGFSLNFPRREGLVTLDLGTLYLPLLPGPNELLLAVTEVANGWGFVGRLAPTPGVQVETTR